MIKLIKFFASFTHKFKDAPVKRMSLKLQKSWFLTDSTNFLFWKLTIGRISEHYIYLENLSWYIWMKFFIYRIREFKISVIFKLPLSKHFFLQNYYECGLILSYFNAEVILIYLLISIHKLFQPCYHIFSKVYFTEMYYGDKTSTITSRFFQTTRWTTRFFLKKQHDE